MPKRASKISVLAAALAAVCAFFAAPIVVSQFSKGLSEVLTNSPYVSLDEAGPTEAALSVFDGGYRGYRCRVGNGNFCYGGAQPLLDAAILKALPRSWVTEEQILQGPGWRWGWLLKYPHMGLVMRLARWLAALGILAALAFVARGLGKPLALGAVAMVGTSGAFIGSWEGIKNDHYSVFFALPLLVLLNLALRLRGRQARRAVFLLASAAGMFALNVRVAILPAYLAAIAAYFLGEVVRRTRPAALARDALLVVASGAAAYLALNPNTFVSGFEARWIMGFLGFVNGGSEAMHRLARQNLGAEARLAALSLWPLLPLAAMVATFARKRGWREALIRWPFYLVVPAGLGALLLKSAPLLEAYYLPATVTACCGLLLVARELPAARHALGCALLAGTLAQLAITGRLDLRAWRQLSLPSARPPTALDLAVNQSPYADAPRWLIDRSLHAPLREGRLPADRIAFFDSLSQSPREVLTDALPDEARVLVACWADPSEYRKAHPNITDPEHIPIDAPSANQWSAVTRQLCASKEPALPAYLADYAYADRPGAFVVARALELKQAARTLKTAPVLEAPRLDLRLLSGGDALGEHYEHPRFAWQSHVELSGTYRLPRGLRRVRLPVTSICRHPGTVTLTVGDASSKVSVDTRDAFCGTYPHLCKWDRFARWSQRYYPSTPPEAAVNVSLRPGSTAEIRVTVDKQDDDCRVIFRPLELEYVGQPQAIGVGFHDKGLRKP